MKVLLGLMCFVFVLNVVSDVAADEVSVMEGESVTLNTGFIKTQQDRMRWYFNDNRVAELNGDQMKICADDVCPETFRGRLKLDKTSGSLIILNTTKTDSGLYQLEINRRTEKKFILTVQSPLRADAPELSVSVMVGDSVTLCTGFQRLQKKRIMWYFYVDRIAEIIGYQCKICKDDRCPQRYRDKLKLDNQTGSLTIMKISTADSGLYTLNYDTEKVFRVVVDGSAEESDILKRKSVIEGESITLDTDIKTTSDDVLKWYFGEILLAEITGDQSQVCEDVQCKDGKEGFRDRLKVNLSSGSLTIFNSRTADSGEYTLLINSTSFYINRTFLTVIIAATGLSINKIMGICAASVVLLLLMITLIAICYKKKKDKKRRDLNCIEMQHSNLNSVSDPYQNAADNTSQTQDAPLLGNGANETSQTQDAPLQNDSANKTSYDQKDIPYMDDVIENQPKPGIKVIQTEKGVVSS